MNLRIDRATLVAWGAFMLSAVFILAVAFDVSGSRPKSGVSLEPVRWAPQRSVLSDATGGLVKADKAFFLAPGSGHFPEARHD
jgi:hypothetical protein